MSRRDDIERFYGILQHVGTLVGGCRLLRDCTSKSQWPQRGVYFFFEPHEVRENGRDLRVVRVGTHAITATSRSSLWSRLRTHRGQAEGRGNHRGSIFRKRIGDAILRSVSGYERIGETWDIGSTATKDIRHTETPLEQEVSRYIGAMPFLWIGINDAPSAVSHRGYIERNSIALLSNFDKPAIDGPSDGWLGLKSKERTIQLSGLWNTNHVRETYDTTFLSLLESYTQKME